MLVALVVLDLGQLLHRHLKAVVLLEICFVLDLARPQELPE